MVSRAARIVLTFVSSSSAIDKTVHRDSGLAGMICRREGARA